jgi:hypothetical protein
MKIRLIALFAVFSIMAFGSSAYAGGLLGGTRTIDIKMTGFCDGYNLTINMNTGIVTGHQTGCDSELVFGTIGSLIGFNQKGAALTLRDTTFATYKVIRDNATWTYYNSDGSVANSGTYTMGVPAAPELQSSISSND